MKTSILTSKRLALVLAFLSIGMILVSCTVGSGLPASPFQAAAEAKDYCPEINRLVDEFNAIAFDGYLNDDADTMDDMAFSAKKMSGLVKRAESEGVDLADAEVSWLKNLGLSADSFVILAQAAPNTFSDEELRGYLERIIGWYDVAAEECRVVVA